MTEPKIKKVCMHDEVEIRWDSLRSADGAPGIVDVWCACGTSGSVRIDPDDIQWDHADDKKEED